MKLPPLAIALFSLLYQPNSLAQPIIPSTKVDTLVRKQFRSDWKYTNTVMVILKKQADLSGADALPTREQKIKFVYQQLRTTALATQVAIVSYLKSKNVNFRQYYIQNMIAIENPSAELINALALRDDVAQIKGNPVTPLKPILHPIIQYLAHNKQAAQPGLVRIGATKVWDELHHFGEGILIASQDSGVQWDHPALQHQYRGWSDNQINHNYNWHDAIRFPFRKNGTKNRCGYNLQIPCDDTNHGTHTVGTMLGHDQQEKIGVAPKARWIACKNMDNNLGSLASYLECFEFFLAPYPLNGNALYDGDTKHSPHIVSNSWMCNQEEGCDGNEMEFALTAMKKAGIFVVAAAGNEGPNCYTIANPPGMHTNLTFAIGAIDSTNDKIAYFSSRGPSTFDGGIGPHITAPGVSVRSAIPNNKYAIMSGTSMATPHVAGAIALLWSAKPNLIGKIDDTIVILEKTAEPQISSVSCGGIPGSGIPNNTYGYGILNIYAAIKQ